MALRKSGRISLLIQLHKSPSVVFATQCRVFPDEWDKPFQYRNSYAVTESSPVTRLMNVEREQGPSSGRWLCGSFAFGLDR